MDPVSDQEARRTTQSAWRKRRQAHPSQEARGSSKEDWQVRSTGETGADVEEDGQKIFFGGDIAPQYQQMKYKFIAKYDYDGKLCMELRQKWWQQGELEKWTFLFYHDIKTPVFSF